MGWRLEPEGDYFHIFGDDRNIAGYLDPDYGRAGREEDQDEIREDAAGPRPVPGAFLMVPMVKFGIFEDRQLDVRTLQGRLDLVGRRVLAWRDLLENLGTEHWIGVSHTDTDMLAVTIRLRFAAPVPLRRTPSSRRWGLCSIGCTD